jgi:hypothetical protein
MYDQVAGLRTAAEAKHERRMYEYIRPRRPEAVTLDAITVGAETTGHIGICSVVRVSS